MKIVGHTLTVFGVIVFMAAFTRGAQHYQIGYVMVGVILLALGYLAYQHKPGYRPRAVSPEDLTRLGEKFTRVKSAAEVGTINISYPVQIFNSFMTIWIDKNRRFVTMQNGQIGVCLNTTWLTDFTEGGLDYDELYEAERLLDQYLRRIPSAK